MEMGRRSLGVAAVAHEAQDLADVHPVPHLRGGELGEVGVVVVLPAGAQDVDRPAAQGVPAFPDDYPPGGAPDGVPRGARLAVGPTSMGDKDWMR